MKDQVSNPTIGTGGDALLERLCVWITFGLASPG